MSIEDNLNEAKALFERLKVKALVDGDRDQEEIYHALYSVADAVYQLRKDIERIELAVQEVKRQ